MNDSTWNDQERLAALKRLREGVDAAIEVLTDRTKVLGVETRADRWRTQFGTVSIATRKDSVYVKDQEAFLEFVRSQDVPGAVVETVAEPFRKGILDRLRVRDMVGLKQVYDPATGEPVEWAGVKPGGQYVTVRGDDEAKSQAIDWALAWVDALPKEIGT